MAEILVYCLAHPDAKDTPAGILKWWLPASAIRWRPAEVGAALEVMTTRGWVTRRAVANAEQLYRLNKDKIPEIEDFLINSQTGSGSQ